MANLGIAEHEGIAIYHVTERLFGDELEERLEIINGFVAGEGEVQGVSCPSFILVYRPCKR